MYITPVFLLVWAQEIDGLSQNNSFYRKGLVRENLSARSCLSCSGPPIVLFVGNANAFSALTFLTAHDYLRLSPFHMSCRLESQMTTDIQTILQLLQKQTTVVPPAYSMVTAGTEYQRPVLRLLRTSQPRASIKTDRSFSPSSQVSVDTVKPRESL